MAKILFGQDLISDVEADLRFAVGKPGLPYAYNVNFEVLKSLIAGSGSVVTVENTTVYDPMEIYEAGNIFVSFVNENSSSPFDTAALYRSRETTEAGISPEDSLYNVDTNASGKWEYQGTSVTSQDGGLGAIFYNNEASIKAITGYKNGDNVVNIETGDVYEYIDAERIGLKPNNHFGIYGRWRYRFRLIKSDQTQKQTLTKSPIFGNLTPGRLVFVDEDRSLIDTNLFWDSVGKKLGINGVPTTIFDVIGNYAGTIGNLVPQMAVKNISPTTTTSRYAHINTMIGNGFPYLPHIGLQAQAKSGGGGETSLRNYSNFPFYIFMNNVKTFAMLPDGKVGILTTLPKKGLEVGSDAGYVSSVDEGTGDTDFASHKFVNDSISAIVSSQTVTSSEVVTPTGNKRENEVYITAQSEALTIANPSGTPVNGNTLLIRVKDDGTAREIMWGNLYKGFSYNLPATTILGKEKYIGFIYNSNAVRWDLVSVVDEKPKPVLYGYLYNFYAVNNGLAPTGLKVPTDAEWTTLTDYLGGTSVAGGKLKETGIEHWNSPNTGATNEFGFTALSGGSRYSNGSFNNIGNNGNWWSATENNTNNAWGRYINYDRSGVGRNDYDAELGFSVRMLVTDTTTYPAGSQYVDLDGNIYDVIQIGTQHWLKQNWACTKYTNGDLIPNVTDDTEWANLTTGARCAYNNDEDYV